MNKKLIIVSLFILILTTMNQLYAQENDRTFAPSNRVKVESIHFKNRFGITLAADLYMPHWPQTSTCHSMLQASCPPLLSAAPSEQSKNNHRDFMPKPWPNVVF